MTTGMKILKTDAQLQEDVLDELRWDGRVQPNEVGVTVKDGVVTLSGEIETFTKKWVAEEAALRVRGVKAVANDLEAHLPSMAERTDEEVAQAVVRALTWDVDVPASEIQVTVSNGWVTLKGKVDVLFQRVAALRAVRHLTGVRGVSNLLEVRQATPAPADVKQRIERALVRNAEVDAKGIRIEIHDHTAVLRGIVRSDAERRAAAASAASAPGISEVDNYLLIEE
ncbi:MAG TPA: BON domain-containing protein [Ktedonobacterales bacterium]